MGTKSNIKDVQVWAFVIAVLVLISIGCSLQKSGSITGLMAINPNNLLVVPEENLDKAPAENVSNYVEQNVTIPLNNLQKAQIAETPSLRTGVSRNQVQQSLQKLSVGIFGDTTPPTVNLSSPLNKSTTNVSAVTFICNITDNVGVQGLELHIWNASNYDLLVSNISESWHKLSSDIVSDDNPYGLALDNQANVLVAGNYFNHQTAFVDNIKLVKYNTAGTLQWNILWKNDPTSWYEAWDVAADSSGNIYTSGTTNLSAYNYVQNTTWQMLTVKFNSAGVSQWNRTFGVNTSGNAIATDSSGNVYVVGFNNGTIGGRDYYWPYISKFSDILIVKYDTNGNYIWNRTIGSPAWDNAYGVTVDSQDNIYVAGGTNVSGNPDFWTLKLNSTGDVLWNKTIGTLYPEVAYSVTTDGTGNVYVTGGSGWSLFGPDLSYFFTVKYNSSGAYQWNRTLISSPNDQYAKQALVDPSNNIYILGDYDTGLGIRIVKYDTNGSLLLNMTMPGYPSTDFAMDKLGYLYVTGPFSANGNIDVNFSTYKFAGFSKGLSGTSNSSTWTVTLPSTGVYQWNCLGTDNSSNNAWGQYGNYTLTFLDVIPPGTITNPANQSQGRTWVYFNWTNPADSDFNSTLVYINGTNIYNVSTPTNFLNATLLTCETAYNFTFFTKDNSGNINKTGITRIVSTTGCAPTILVSTTACSDFSPPGTITNLVNTSTGTTWIYFNWTNPIDTDFNKTIIFQNGTNIINLSNPINYFNDTSLMCGTRYNISILTADNSGNINTNPVTIIVNTGSCPDITPPGTISNLTNQSQGTTWIYFNWTNPTDPDFNSTIIYLNGTNIANLSTPINYINLTSISSQIQYNLTILTIDNSGNINTTPITNLFVITQHLGECTPGASQLCTGNPYCLGNGIEYCNASGFWGECECAPSIPILIYPINGTNIINRLPTFIWNASTDVENRSLEYEIQVDNHSDFSSPILDDITMYNITNYTTNLPMPLDVPIFWRVRANNTYALSAFSNGNFTVLSSVIVSLVNTTIDFGQLNHSVSKNTSQNNPSPFLIRNDGNVNVNITVNGTSLWYTDPSPTSSYQFQIRVNESNSFDTSHSTMFWTNIPIISSSTDVGNLNWQDGNDSVYMDVLVTVPAFEPEGARNATILIDTSKS